MKTLGKLWVTGLVACCVVGARGADVAVSALPNKTGTIAGTDFFLVGDPTTKKARFDLIESNLVSGAAGQVQFFSSGGFGASSNVVVTLGTYNQLRVSGTNATYVDIRSGYPAGGAAPSLYLYNTNAASSSVMGIFNTSAEGSGGTVTASLYGFIADSGNAFGALKAVVSSSPMSEAVPTYWYYNIVSNTVPVQAPSFTASGVAAGSFTLGDTDNSAQVRLVAPDTINTNVNLILPTEARTGLLLSTVTEATNATVTYVAPGTAGQVLTSTGTGFAFSNAAAGSSTTFNGNNALLSWEQLYVLGDYTGGQSTAAASSNVTFVNLIYIPHTQTISNFTAYVWTPIAGSFHGIGMYALDGSLIWTNTFSSASTAYKNLSIGAPVTLTNGYYYLAYTKTDPSTWMCAAFSANAMLLNNNSTAPIVAAGTAANGSSAGLLPATLGAITKNDGTGANAGSKEPPIVLFW